MYTIKSLNLTEKGFAVLAQFPAEALHHADTAIVRCGSLNDPFSYFIGIARKYCADRSLRIDYSITNRLMAAYELMEDMPNLTNQEINRPETKRTASSSPSVGYDMDAVKDRIRQRNLDAVEEMRVTDPERYARHMGRVETMQNMLGIDAHGNVLDQSNPPTAQKFLEGLSYISSGDFEFKSCSFKVEAVEPSETNTTDTPPAPLDAEYEEIVAWWNRTHMGSFKSSSIYARLDHQLKTKPSKEVLKSIRMLMDNWPTDTVKSNENRLQ